jgi:hypothetical protein
MHGQPNVKKLSRYSQVEIQLSLLHFSPVVLVTNILSTSTNSHLSKLFCLRINFVIVG